MTSTEFIKCMQYPSEWLEWNMLPADLVRAQMSKYKPGDEQRSAHYRSDALFWWLNQNPPKETLLRLVDLTFLDPDPILGAAIRMDYIAHARHTDDEVRRRMRIPKI